ncbi:unnamed protein product [Rotaria sp. Silwood1]|nr:unnamed protein product [Rotaria sp. Silwood1]CAF1686067.1 unnamed protein product [Rotaria sp. Silwood1]CAF3902085.1 unnamed protein product [Rotaria sp. Silwood1]CAF3932240.1 unnamed protein product [Rotaria sp. Silwood1]CAF4026326.1 unnamed protein product [Rotaria sp. Silwood1]
MYGITTAFVIPLSISMNIYGIIFYYARTSSQRIAPSTSNTMTAHIPNARREMKLARNMLIIETLFTAAGTPLLILYLWQVMQPKSPPPESFYLLSLNSISLFITLMMVMLFYMNKDVKDIAFNYRHGARRHMHPVSTSNRREQMLQVTRY